MKNFRVCLIAMPFIGVESPSHAIGLLKRYFQDSGAECDCLYLNLTLAAELGLDTYNEVSEESAAPSGNLCFAKAAYGNAVPELEEGTIHYRLQDKCAEFIEACVRRYNWASYHVVGFTTAMSVSTTASIALARRIKEEYGTLIAIGGTAMFFGAGEEYAKLPWLDYVFTSHMDHQSISEFINAVQGLGSLGSIAGLCYKEGSELRKGPVPPLSDMDKVPVPDYTDYFRQIRSMPFVEEPAFTDSLLSGWIYAELGRGCFYGDRQTCSFCSEVDTSLSTHRSLEAGVRYLQELAFKYPNTKRIFLTDPLISRQTQRKILPEWNKRRPRSQLYFAEVKPWMSRGEIRELADCGVTSVQCGIESLHPKIIKLLRKGQKSHTCITALKWFKTFGIEVFWNFLIQVPGEDQLSYFDMAQIIPMLRHLPKPTGTAYPVHITKGSPYWKERRQWRFANLRPHRTYQYIIPNYLDQEILSYAWEYDVEGTSCFDVSQPGHMALQKELEAWLAGNYTLQLQGNVITDSRDGHDKTLVLTDEERALLIFCDSPRNADQLTRFSSQALESLLNLGVIMISEHKFLELPIISDEEMEGNETPPFATAAH